MARYFNTAGPCQPEQHYFIPPEHRLSGVRARIDKALFFVLHAPRQMGKTTLLNTLARSLNQEGRYAALVVDVEFLQRITDAKEGNLALIDRIYRNCFVTLPEATRAPDPAPFCHSPLQALHDYLRVWSEHCPQSVILTVP
jgi:energy-coupling factor transporter ATP-binding protein EcfA2